MFWPLISATVAVGAVVTYTRWRSEGRGWLSDIAWVIAAATLAIGFVSQPSQIMLQVDGLREQLAAKVITGTTTALTPDAKSVTGFANPQLTGPPQEVAGRSPHRRAVGFLRGHPVVPGAVPRTRHLQTAGAHKLAGDDTWTGWENTMADNGQVTEFGTWQNWVRGMDLGRLGYVLILLMMALPMAILTLILVIAGFTAVIGFAAMFLLGVVALVGWPIPGWFRRFGTKWWEYTLGLQFQALFVTVILAAVMLVSKFIGSHVDKYGFFIVGLLNIVLMFWAVKARAFIESLTMMGGGGSAGMLGMMASWTAMRAGGWALGKVGHLGRQIARSPYNAGRYVRDRAKGLDWTSRTGGPKKAGIPGMKHVDAYRIPDLDNGPRQLAPPPPPAIGGGPAAIGPTGSGGGGGPLVPRPPRGGPPATRPPGPRRPHRPAATGTARIRRRTGATRAARSAPSPVAPVRRARAASLQSARSAILRPAPHRPGGGRRTPAPGGGSTFPTTPSSNPPPRQAHHQLDRRPAGSRRRRRTRLVQVNKPSPVGDGPHATGGSGAGSCHSTTDPSRTRHDPRPSIRPFRNGAGHRRRNEPEWADQGHGGDRT